ncbi:D-alanyl-D-alanine carboxypeptidase [Streptococcus rupicaprae]|uniref:D-alanyl-D-alanine carboxypeptidase n=1 Tax=Streptococcus rupicaprae TaxID=759619 RepID=A0ABV2FGW7_9STRE
MKAFKKLVLAGFLLISLSACSSPKQESATTSPASSSEEKVQVTEPTYNGSYYSVTGKLGDEIVLVNKKHPLSADYAPGEDPTAQQAFLKILAEMQSLGFSVSEQYSGYRSYDYQASLYDTYVARDGQAEADRYSARPGYSEHQTGLAFDVLDGNGQLLEESDAVSWLENHAHDYGFIVRYPADKEKVTGYMGETWHLRYIGQEAKDIYESGLTLEEYFKVPGGDYED